MSKYPFKVAVRDQGLYLIKEESSLSAQQIIAKNVCSKLESLKGQYDTDKIQQIIAYDGQILFKVFGALKFLLFRNIRSFENSIIREPRDIQIYINQILRESFENEEVHFELVNLIEENRDKLEQELKNYKNEIFLNLARNA